MKSTIKCMLSIVLVGSLLMTIGCQDTDGPDFDQGEFTMESFPDLTVEELNNIITPFQDAVSSAGGRSQNDTNTVIAAILELLDGATIIGVDEGEERGLAVIKVKILLANEAILEVVIVPENLKVLEVEGHRGPFDYDIDPGGDFITLQEGLQAALSAQDGDIVRWELELEEDNEWEFEVHIELNGVRYEVEIDAFTGEVIAVNQMDEADDDEFEEEEKEDELPQAIIDAVASMIEGEILFAESEEEDGEIFWEVLVETASGAAVHLGIIESSLELVYAGDEEGPFDYDLNPGEGFISLAEILESVKGQLQAEIYYWEFEMIEADASGERAFAYFIKVLDASGAYYKVGINAKTGEWFDHEGELPENIAEAVAAIIDADVLEFHREQRDDGTAVWYIYVETAGGAVVKLAITDDTEDLIYAKDYEGPFDYDLLPAEGFLSLQEALGPVEEEYSAETYKWEYTHDETSAGTVVWVYIIKVVDENDEFVFVGVDAQTGDWLWTEDGRTPPLPAEIETAVADMIEADIVEYHKEADEAGNHFWFVYVKTASEAVVKLVFTYETHDLVYAGDENGPFDYELTLGGNFRLLSDNLAAAEALFTINDTAASTQSWEFDDYHNDAAGTTAVQAFIIVVKSVDERFWEVIYDAKSGDILSEKEID